MLVSSAKLNAVQPSSAPQPMAMVSPLLVADGDHFAQTRASGALDELWVTALAMRGLRWRPDELRAPAPQLRISASECEIH